VAFLGKRYRDNHALLAKNFGARRTLKTGENMAPSKKKMLIAASIAGLMTVAASQATTSAIAAESVPCYGINACKGTGDCGGKDYSCAGKNACKGTGFVKLPADTCTRINGGKLTA
jgi:uncharacterized membrane protein